MNPMKTKKEAIAFCASLVLVALFLIPIEAKAESWKEVIPNRYSYNSDFTFVDRGTGFIVVETADANNDGAFFYALTERGGRAGRRAARLAGPAGTRRPRWAGQLGGQLPRLKSWVPDVNRVGYSIPPAAPPPQAGSTTVICS